MKAVWHGTVLVESDQTVEVEGNHYFPLDAIKQDHFQESETRTDCCWKGEASYYHIVVDGKTNEDAAWYYSDPKQAAKQIKGHVAFWKGVEVS